MGDQSAGPQAWPGRSPLSDIDFNDFVALRRLHLTSGVVKAGDHYFANTRRMPAFVEEALIVLVAVGHATLGEPEPESAAQRVTVSESGRARYLQLCEAQRISPEGQAP
jgi:hypothetical protein